jgi:DNA-binding LacI/PurR family transcriptional regulator
VGLVSTDSLPYAFQDEASSGFLQGVALACERAATSLLLMPLVMDREDSIAQIDRAAVDSMIIYCIADNDRALAAVLKRRIPVVIVDGPREVPGTDWVGLDQIAASAETARLIAALGHREVAILCHRLSDEVYIGNVDDRRLAEATYPVQRERVAGFKEEFLRVTQGQGIVHIAERVVSDIASGRAGADAIMRDFPNVTAIICTCDALAQGVMAAAGLRGLRVPEDLSVTGFDDIPSAKAAGITTVWQPLVEKGEVAGEMLLGHPQVLGSREHALPTRLVVRSTTGPAPRRAAAA